MRFQYFPFVYIGACFTIAFISRSKHKRRQHIFHSTYQAPEYPELSSCRFVAGFCSAIRYEQLSLR